MGASGLAPPSDCRSARRPPPFSILLDPSRASAYSRQPRSTPPGAGAPGDHGRPSGPAAGCTWPTGGPAVTATTSWGQLRARPGAQRGGQQAGDRWQPMPGRPGQLRGDRGVTRPGAAAMACRPRGHAVRPARHDRPTTGLAALGAARPSSRSGRRQAGPRDARWICSDAVDTTAPISPVFTPALLWPRRPLHIRPVGARHNAVSTLEAV